MLVHPTTKLIARAGLGAAVLLATLGAAGGVAGASGTAPALTARQIADYDRPAVDLIKSNTTATLNIYAVKLNVDAVVSFANQDSAVQQAVQNSDDATIEQLLLQEIDSDPSRYLTKGTATSYSSQVGAQGSAFTITPDGYLVTNAHVATVDPKELTAGLLGDLPQQQVDDLTQGFSQQFTGINDASGNALAVPSGAGQLVQDIITKFVTSTADASNIHNTLTVYEGLSPANDNPGMVARVVVAGQGFPGKDVAVLKVDANNLPTLPLGDDTLLHDLDHVYAIGYPGAATFDPNVVKTTTYESTVTEGVVSNRLQSSAANYEYIEHTATTNHGNSGGALINDQGQVVGITTAGDSSSESTPVDNGGLLFYAVPSSVVQQFLHQAGVTPSMSPAQRLFEQATDLLASNNRAAAYAKLLKAQALGFNTPYLAQELSATGCPQAAGCRPTGHASAPLAAGGGVAALVVLVLAGSAVVRARKRSTTGVAPQLPATPAETWWTTPVPTAPPRLNDSVGAVSVPPLSAPAAPVAGPGAGWWSPVPADRT